MILPSRRPIVSFFLVGLIASAGLAGCSSRPDIVGHNSEAQDWAAEQRRLEAQQLNQLSGDRLPQNPEPVDRPPAPDAPRPKSYGTQPQAAQPQPQPAPQAQPQN